MPKKLSDYFNDSDKLKITDEIARHMLMFKDDPKKPEDEKFGKVDFQFDLSKGMMQGADANTYFAFDIEQKGILYDFFKAIHADEIDDEEETIKKLNDFINSICKDLSNAYSVTLQEVVRNRVLPDSKEWIIPLDNIEIIAIEMVDYSSVEDDDKYTMKIAKYPDKDVNMEAIYNKIAAIKEENPDKTSAQIVREQKENGDPDFEGIYKVVRGDKYLWDISISMFVDYSLSDTFVASQSIPER